MSTSLERIDEIIRRILDKLAKERNDERHDEN